MGPEGPGWPDRLTGRDGGVPWTRFGAVAEVDWTERGLVICGDGDYPAQPLLDLAEAAGWPVLAEPSSNARTGPLALSAYQYLLSDQEFLAAHQPDVIISAGRPGSFTRPARAAARQRPGAACSTRPGSWSLVRSG